MTTSDPGSACPQQHWGAFQYITEIFILVPALLGLKGNLEMTLASRLSTAVRRWAPQAKANGLCRSRRGI